MIQKSEMAHSGPLPFRTLVRLLMDRAQWHPDRNALTFRDDEGGEVSLSYANLMQKVVTLSEAIRRGGRESSGVKDLQPGDRAMLLFPPGLNFVVAFLACQYSRLVPVPTCFPKPGRAMPRLDAVASDCIPSLLLADRKTLDGIDAKRHTTAVTSLRQIAVDEVDVSDASQANSRDWEPQDATPDELGLLQYTSGSTSDPKGVMVSHANLMENFESIRSAFGLLWSEKVSDPFTHLAFWLPPFHDMGLIGGILETLYIGGHAELMSPRAFLSKPLRWLETISKTGATVSGAPNFAYELCVDRISSDEAAGLDLSRLEIAFCGAEPISAETLQRFAQRFAVAGFRTSSLLPCYGLAEATLLVASRTADSHFGCLQVDREPLRHGRVVPVPADHPRGATQTLVSCGRPCEGMTIEIVDPQSRTRCEDGHVGEIWLQGESIAKGYWQRPETTAERFHATLAHDTPSRSDEYFRTGDLGFVYDTELYITGRCKDVIIVRGCNHYPQDIEATVQQSMPDLVIACVALATSGFTGDALSLVVEVSRHTDDSEMPNIVRTVRRRVIENHEIDARQILICKPATIPMTTSGKVQRSACRRMLESEEINARHQWSRPIVSDDSYAAQLPALPDQINAPSATAAEQQIRAWLMAWLVARCGVDAREVAPDIQFADHGLDSMSAVELSGEIDDWLGVELSPLVMIEHPTPATLAKYLVEESLDAAPASLVR